MIKNISITIVSIFGLLCISLPLQAHEQTANCLTETEIEIILANGTPQAEKARQQLRQPLCQYNLNPWIWTQEVKIETGASAVFFPLVTSAVTPDTTKQDVKVIVDPRIELMSVVQLLSDYFLVSNYTSLYKRDVRTYFSRYANHPVVKIFSEMVPEGFAFDAVPNAMLALSMPPELQQKRPFPGNVIKRAGGIDSLRQFISALQDFAKTSNFMTFFRAHKGSFQMVIDSTRQQVQRAVEVLTKYTGLHPRNSTVILGMLLHDGGFGARLQTGKDSMKVYAIIGPTGSKNGLPIFGSAERLMGLIWHEFSHSIINPLTRKHIEKVKQYASLLKPIEKKMDRWGYDDWETVVNEHIIRAIGVRLTYHHFGPKAAEKMLEKQIKRGFRYVPALVEKLKEYEQNRQKYETIAEFYPRLLEVFAPASE